MTPEHQNDDPGSASARPKRPDHRLSYREFRELAHKGSDETYYIDKYLFRRISIAGSYLLSFTRISPNAVTFISLLSTVAAVWFFMHPTTSSLLIGCGLVFFYHYLDHVDGELARVYSVTRDYRSGIAGSYFDLFCHSFTVNLWLPALAFGLYQETEQPLIVFAGILAMPAMSNFTQYVGAYMFITRVVAEPSIAASQEGREAMEAVTGRHRQVAAVQAGVMSGQGLRKLAKEIIGYPGMLFLVIVAAVCDAFLGTIWGRLAVIVVLAGIHGANNVRRIVLISRSFAKIG